MSARITIVGGGLAGSEAALQLAARGIAVDLFEMRPQTPTPAHRTDQFAELVCSNSFKSTSPSHASGLLKEEMARAGCMLLALANECRVEAGTALALDRNRFSALVTERILSEPLVHVQRSEVTEIPEGDVILATGPLTSDALARSMSSLLGIEQLHFYDATAPIVDAATIDRSIAFEANRRDAGSGHYLNCPFDEAQYETFYQAVLAAEQYPLHEFEDAKFFEACMPIDDLARRGRETLRFGPMRPIGLIDPRTGRRPYAVVQLRPENRAGSSYNLVGFQNRMRRGDQLLALRTIPGLEQALFHRFGRVHRNTYLDAPKLIGRTLHLRREPRITIAGQLTGLEGYVESMATGMLAAVFVADRAQGREPAPPPRETALGALLACMSDYEGKEYRPTNINFGLFPDLTNSKARGRDKAERMVKRALAALDEWLASRLEGVSAQ